MGRNKKQGDTIHRSVRMPIDLKKDLDIISRIYFGGNINATVVSACRKMVQDEKLKQSNLTNTSKDG